MDQNAYDFIKELEAEYGQPIDWKTYSMWFGRSDGTVRDYGVLLFRIGDIMYYEDFEKQRSILGFQLPKKSHAPAFVKLKGNFSCREVKDICKVVKASAATWLRTPSAPPLRPASKIIALLRQTVTMITMDDGTMMFFELLDEKAFKENIAQYKEA
ncbi:hypothetical protein [Parasphaerochaeta coccoides]|uniref:Uncharacterized protein n=1 Tax=Parasphaerochaeta coccoides (strain ATCC BAA-1237 / DSM 17374 / SPN1) TaxID=760011 RepID=F4GIP5_PARC1|nr:hypothetical protein [Parasphaerochaeta coccoides]AEC02179.1 hypothetical protein Spico_0955 [Parasphaerochaeta coccoides DSM 17374]